ncbi:MAG: response regulator transcription factor [Anaerolineales bacterium]|nr:response regulator transcription factor [Anaerolineales bacterium]
MEPANILVIEDDYIVARTIERSLRSDEFCIRLVSRGEKGLHMARQEPPDLVILDIIMPEMDGYQVCRAMRADPSLADIPILFLTARVKPQDRIAGFNAGGDDYLCKPFNVDELIMRVRAILRRTHPYSTRMKPNAPWPRDASPMHCLRVGNYVLDTRSFELQTPRRGKVRLTPLQYDLLYHLMTHPGEAFPPARLLDEVWDYPSGRGSPDLVRVHIKTLRERIENDPRDPTFIRTLPGQGYTVGCLPN